MTERFEERRAKVIVAATIGLDIEHADTDGRVDYRSSNGAVALEVTRFTDERLTRDTRVWADDRSVLEERLCCTIG